MFRPNDVVLPINKAGWPFIGIFAVLTALLALTGWPAFFVGLVLTGWCIYFFRDPARATPTKPGLIVSPADGRVILIKEVEPEESLGLGSDKRIRVSVFLNVFDVHVNRIPVEGTVVHTHYRPGKFVNASLDKASVDNERMALAIEIADPSPCAGQRLGVVQIAGLIARRIVCHAEVGQRFKTGQRYGLIRFGSRTDIYLPVGVNPMVCIGQRMICGETVIADCSSKEEARQAEVR